MQLCARRVSRLAPAFSLPRTFRNTSVPMTDWKEKTKLSKQEASVIWGKGTERYICEVFCFVYKKKSTTTINQSNIQLVLFIVSLFVHCVFCTFLKPEFLFFFFVSDNRAGTGEYNKHYPKSGYYACKVCATPLYSAAAKFDSGCGWPAFDKCYKGSIKTHTDTSLGMKRVEIVVGGER